MDTEKLMASEQLPLPETHRPLTHATGVNPQQHSIAPPIPTSVAGPQVVNLRGASFREAGKTATEIMLELKSENEELQQKLTKEKRNYDKLSNRLKSQRKISQKLASKVDQSQTEAARLRAMISKLQVEVDRLVVDNASIKKQSESALREIESNLDTVLLDSISRAREKPFSTNK